MTTPHSVVPERLETLILARLSSSGKPPTEAMLAQALQRYAPATVTGPQWRELVAQALQELQRREIVTAERGVARSDELVRRIGSHSAKRWQRRFDQILPALALGLRSDDTRAHDRLKGRDAWSAAIAGRAFGVWTDGLPPSPSRVCDMLVWRELGLSGRPRSCPPEVRAYFLRDHVVADRGSPLQLLRQRAAQAIEAPRVDGSAIVAGLVRMWLTGREVTPRLTTLTSPISPTPSHPHVSSARLPPRELQAPQTPPLSRGSSARSIDHSASHTAHIAPGGEPPLELLEPSLVATVRTVAEKARDGVFGDRKVFISSVWNALRAVPPWTALALDDFKAELIAAHRRQELVLARADLVAAMDPTLVASSETRTDGATFHFIVREPTR
jgi:hypothetical protein